MGLIRISPFFLAWAIGLGHFLSWLVADVALALPLQDIVTYATANQTNWKRVGRSLLIAKGMNDVDFYVLEVDPATGAIPTTATLTFPASSLDYGASASALRTASQIGNTTGAASFGAGAASGQTLRTVIATDQSAIPVSQSGAWSVSVPGVATAANQTTANASLASIDAKIANPMPVTGTVAATQGTSPWTVAGTVTANQGTSPWVTSAAQSGAWSVGRTWTLSDATDSVSAVQGTSPWVTSRTWALGSGTDSVAAVQSGTWTVQQGSPPWSVSLSGAAQDYGASASALRTAAQIGNATGAAAFGAGTTSGQTLRVVLPTDQTAIPASQSGTWTVQQGTPPWSVSGTVSATQGTSPWVVGGTVTSNQGGAPWTVTGTGTAGTPAAGVVTVQGIAAMTPLLVDGSAVTQPVSGTVTANQGTSPWVTSAAQSGTWSLRLQDGSGNAITSQASGSQRALDVGINVAGVQVDPRTRTWTLASGTDSVSAVVTSSVLPTGAATAANQSTEIASLASIDGKVRSYDLDTGAGTEAAQGVVLRKSASGGSVELGTSSDPVRTDPTGTTTQPISGTVTANQGGTWTVQPGNTANTTPWLASISQGGNTATVTGANALKVDGSAVTQPVSQSGTWTVSTKPVTSGSTTHVNGNVDTTADAIPSVAGNVIREILVKSPTTNPVGDTLYASFDGGTTFLSMVPGEVMIWEPKGDLTQIHVKGSDASVAYEIVLNRE